MFKRNKKVFNKFAKISKLIEVFILCILLSAVNAKQANAAFIPINTINVNFNKFVSGMGVWTEVARVTVPSGTTATFVSLNFTSSNSYCYYNYRVVGDDNWANSLFYFNSGSSITFSGNITATSTVVFYCAPSDYSSTTLNGSMAVQISADVADNATVNAAKASADAASTAANSAKASADTAATKAQTTINQTWYSGTYGGSQESVASIAGYIRIL